MNNLKSLVEKVSKLSNCKVHPPCGLPQIKKGHLLLDDVFEFYEICGGIDLFLDAERLIESQIRNESPLTNKGQWTNL